MRGPVWTSMSTRASSPRLLEAELACDLFVPCSNYPSRLPKPMTARPTRGVLAVRMWVLSPNFIARGGARPGLIRCWFVRRQLALDPPFRNPP